MKVFERAEWIWINDKQEKDVYGEFFSCFSIKNEQAICRISCDGDYTLYINDKFVASNQYGDYEHYKVYDEIDITKYLTEKENKFYVLVWHFGEDTQRYINKQAGLIFEIEQNNEIILASNEKVVCRSNSAYLNGYCKQITPQLGFSFLYDSTKENIGDFIFATTVKKNCMFYKRPIEKLQLLPEKQNTILKNEGNYYLVDLGAETVGVPKMEFYSDTKQKILVAWGEDLQNGHVRRIIGLRDFSFEYIAKKGENNYVNYMLRLGCRYLELYTEKPIKLRYFGLLPQVYSIKEEPFILDNIFDQQIYDLCVRTLKLSMMEHYVDTPWREQCLYAFDSRNQMLCGYYAFENGNKEYARANLLLMSKDIREDGLLSICYPCGMDLTIPSFSLYYFIAVKEYVEHTEDITLCEEVYNKLISITNTFLSNMQSGLICTFEGLNHWNFYDWSENLEGKLHQHDTARPDLIINCLFIIALESLRYISDKINKPFNYQHTICKLRELTEKTFYNKKYDAYSQTVKGAEFTVLGNSLAVLSGVAKKTESICEKIVSNKFSDCSLSMKCFVYDALLLGDAIRYKDFVFSEIRSNYGLMIENNATSVWETIDGAKAFDNAGSLCHGWSAIPVYYYKKLKR